jgi:transcriptional regulator GlxA family with amidase domain
VTQNPELTSFHTAPSVKHFVFLTLPGYSLLALATAVDALRVANRVAQRDVYGWTLASQDGHPELSSCGMTIGPTVAIDSVARANIVFVVGGLAVNGRANFQLTSALHRLAQENVPLGALCGGAHALANAGLLDHFKVAVHWDQLSSLREEFPRVAFTDQLFVIDRQRYTCGSGLAPLHLMLEIIKSDLGCETAKAIFKLFFLDRIREESDQQRVPLQARVGVFNERLIEAAALMEANIEEPLEIWDIANLVGVSQRQIERLFKRYVGQTPAQFYLELRLRRAQELLRQTSLTVTEISVACGFCSGQHFSKSYRGLFGGAPSAERVHTPPFLAHVSKGLPVPFKVPPPSSLGYQARAA